MQSIFQSRFLFKRCFQFNSPYFNALQSAPNSTPHFQTFRSTLIRIPSVIMEIACRTFIQLARLNSHYFSPSSSPSRSKPSPLCLGHCPGRFSFDSFEEPDPLEKGGRVRVPMSFAFLDSQR